MARLVVISKNAAGTTLELGEGWATIGRAEGNTLQIFETSISGQHCEVRLNGTELIVRDLLSTNGTFAAGKKVVEGTLHPGQTLRLGDVELRFELAGGVDAGASFTSKMLVTNATAMSAQKNAPAPEKPAVEKSVERDSSAGPDKQFHVLFVDDSMAFLETFGGVCAEHSKHTWAIHTATGADGALAMLREKTIHLVVIDIGMPTLDGLQLLSIITGRYPDMKVAVITGKATETRRTAALANGADLFLEKQLTADGMRAVFNLLNDLVSWTPPSETAVLKKPGGEK